MNDLLLTYYGDDLTGSTDSLEALVLGGVPTVLFLEPPSPDQIKRFPDVRAVGLAGVSRTMTPEEMDVELKPALAGLKALGAPLTHYKVCSTFDSSPEIGSIGKATDIGAEVFDTPLVPVAVGAPKLKRYVIFGNLFATVGDQTFRLDRHPTMSRHPITPMKEGDLRRHLGEQTQRSIDLVDVRHLSRSDKAIDTQVGQLADEGTQVLILDTLDDTHLLKVGRLIWRFGKEKPCFCVGSSGVEFALTAYWQSTGVVQPPGMISPPSTVDQIVAVSGSVSPVTASQIQWALDRGFCGIGLLSDRLIDPDGVEAERLRVVNEALSLLKNGESVILYSAFGPDDNGVARTKERLKTLGCPPNSIGRLLGTQQGLILKDILLQTGLRRAAVAGGDTAGHVLRQLGVYVLELITPLGAATPLCRAGTKDNSLDGLEVALKGGQLGDESFFENVRLGRRL